MSRWKVRCSYDGTDFTGWQSQSDGKSVQDAIEHELQELFDQKIRIQGSGRTDSGVHAEGQVFHMDLDWTSSSMDLLKALRSRIWGTISVDSVDSIGQDFHARYSAVGKLYVYRIYAGYAPPKHDRFCHSWKGSASVLEKLMKIHWPFEGWHDFESFSANNGREYESTWRYIHQLSVSRWGKLYTISVEGNGFMYKMVRSIVGSMLNVASGRLELTDLEKMIDSPKSRTEKVVTAPSKGLCLKDVYYRNRSYPERPAL